MKISFLTLGCRVNQSESDFIEENLRKRGCSIVGLSEHPDYCIVNTCSVTEKTDYQSRQLIRRANKAGAKVIVTGCYSQLRPEDIKNISSKNCIVDNNNKFSIINMIANNIESFTYRYSRRSRPYLKIQDGCNFNCSFCIVPKARGRSKSIDITEVLRQVNEIEDAGYKEIVLTGIHLGSYGKDFRPPINLPELLKTILRETKIQRIRLSSIEIREVNDALIDLLHNDRICKHIHLPLQSGNNTVLRLMNRMYTSEDIVSTVTKIKNKIPDISIGTDIIVGFPGEGEKEFKDTKNLLDSLPFSYMHIFPFSIRPDTIASKMINQCTSSVKKERFYELDALNSKKKINYMIAQLHKTLEVIIEKKCYDGYSIGTSSNYLKVKINSNGYPQKTLVRVRATGIVGNLIQGDLIETI